MDKYLNDVKGEMNCQEEKTFTAVLKVKNEEA